MTVTSKEELERRKLELEIAELDRPAWLRPAYLAVALPILLTVLTFLSALLSGYFDQKRSKLEREIQQMKANLESVKRERDQAQVNLDHIYAAAEGVSPEEIVRRRQNKLPIITSRSLTHPSATPQ